MAFWFHKKPVSLPDDLRREIEAYLRLHSVSCLHQGMKAVPLRSSPPAEEPEEELLFGVFDGDDCAMPAPCLAAPAASRSRSVSLEDFLREEDAGFSETLLRLIDQTGLKDSAIYSRANVSRQHFSKIRNNPGYRPTKPTAIAFAVALALDLDQTRDLIGRAGYALTRSSKFDLIIMYFLERGIHDLHQINAALYEFDQPLLGC